MWKWDNTNAYGYNSANETVSGTAFEYNPRFAGQYFDKETGLHYNLNRMYNPELARYMQPDPIGVNGGMNIYSYVENNPLNMNDPEGLIGWDSLGFAAVGGITNGIVNGLNYYNQNESFAKGFIIGAAAGALGGIVYSFNPLLGGALGGALTQAFNHKAGIKSFENPICDIGFASVTGLIGGALGGISGSAVAVKTSLEAEKGIFRTAISSNGQANIANLAGNANSTIYGIQFNNWTNIGTSTIKIEKPFNSKNNKQFCGCN